MRYALILVLAGVPLARQPGDRIARNEARTMEHLRTLLAAERAYTMANTGLFDDLRCLAAPADCIRFRGGVPPPFLDPALAALPPRYGYRFRFHPGPPIREDARPVDASASSMFRFAITAVPLRPGVSGRRRFCLDQAGFVHESDRKVLVAEDGGCARTARIAQDPVPLSRAEADARIVADLRVLVSAQSAYASANSGCFDQLRCLVSPARCIHGWSGDRSPLLDPAMAELPPRHGYRLRFHPGPPIPKTARPATASASSMLRFAFTAVPLRSGTTARRRLCVDQDGFIREPDAGPLVAKQGGCVRTARVMEDPPPSSPAEAESRVIADLRMLTTGQQAYASANGGFFDRLDCVAEPWRCIPGWPKSTWPLLDPRIASLRERHGYQRRFYPGPPPPERLRGLPYISPTSMSDYAYTAVPTTPGSRGFCIDARDILCQTSDGREPPVVNAQCEPCLPGP